AGDDLLDVHHDPDHHRSVLTVVGTTAPRLIAEAAVDRFDLSTHRGAHPRFGVVDVVPFVPLEGSTMDDAVAARDDFARWMADHLQVPCFVYGPERSLPEVRRRAFVDLRPDHGPVIPHPRAGATAVGAREVMLAYNVWLEDADLPLAARLARDLRDPAVRALAFAVGNTVQVSMNLIAPDQVGPAEVYDRLAAQVRIRRAELVGLAPERIRAAIDPARWDELDLGGDKTIEARLEARRLDRT